MGWSVGKQEISVNERANGGREKFGLPSTPTETTIPGVKATVNPVPGDELQTLPESERAEKNLRVITEYELTTFDDYAGTLADHVVIRGERYEVRDVQIYEKVIPHYEYRVRRVRPELTGSAFTDGFDDGFA